MVLDNFLNMVYNLGDDMFGVKESGAGDVLAGGETQEAGHVLALREALYVTHFAHQGESVAHASADGIAQQLRLGARLDEAIASLEEALLVSLSRADVLGELLEHLLSDGMGESLITESDQLFGLLATKGGAAMVGQNSGDGVRARGDELLSVPGPPTVYRELAFLSTRYCHLWQYPRFIILGVCRR